MQLLIRGNLMFLKGKKVQLMLEKEIWEETLQIKILVLAMKVQKIKEELANKMRDRKPTNKIKNQKMEIMQ
jgi:hypothetical protein